MKTTPQYLVGLTVALALAGGVVLAADEKAVFDTSHAVLQVFTDEAETPAPILNPTSNGLMEP